MPRDTVIKATIDIGARINDFQSAMKNMQSELNKLNVGDEIGKDLESAFKKVQEEIGNISRLTKDDKLNIVDRKEVESTFRKLEKDWDNLIGKLESKKITSSPLKEQNKALVRLNQLRERYNNAIGGADPKIKAQTQRYNDQLNTVKNLASEYDKLNNKTGALTTKRDVAKQELDVAKKALDIRKAETKELENAAEEAKKLLATKEEQRRIEEENFNKQYVQEHGNRKGIKNERDAHMAEWAKQYEEAEAAITKYNEAIKEQQEAYDKAKNNAEGAEDALNKHNDAVDRAEDAWKKAKKSLSAYQGALTKITNTEFSKLKDELNLEEVGIDPKTIQSYEQLEKEIEKLATKDKTKATEVIQGIKKYADSSIPAIDKMGESIRQAGGELDGLNDRQKQLDQMRNNILQFFSIGNAVNLFKRAIHSAVETVKDLDKVMTETAVVTEFSVGDMWTQLPEYTKRANELGVSIHDVYEASTLYYQQGLQTNEVMAVTNATLRMARIASLDAAEATDRITNALRGFNMEINESNADNIADVYSKLAAISASDVDEISTAMTKVASLASSANMQFENTAAFLAQIIETTRESAETAGTALKTVVARFSEVKDLYSKGELLGTDEEGEEIDVNKVSKALRVAGINLNEFLTGQKGLDEIFMDLASKWDDLDIVQQRYIATMAAGSRQQSRFIALMSDYERTQELTTAAQDANGAAMEQYNKTLESLETKTTKLKNAWNEFLMSIANSDVIKGVVDALTGLVRGINKVINAVSGGNGLLKSIAAIGISVGGLKLGRSLFNSIFGDPKSAGKGWMGQVLSIIKGERPAINKTGAEIGESLVGGIKDKFSNLRGLLAKTFSSKLTAKQLGLNTIDFSDANLSVSNIDNKSGFIDLIFDKEFENIDKLSQEKQNSFFKLSESFESGKIGIDSYIASLKELGINTEITGEQADKLGISFKNNSQILKTSQMILTGAGIAFTALGSIIEKVTGESSGFTKVLKNVGIGLTALGSLLPVIDGAFKAFGASVSTTIMNIPIIGWIAAIITAVITLVTILSEVIETPAEAAKSAKESLDQATEAARSAQEAVDNLSSSYSEIVNNADKLDDLTQGTEEWRKAVEENNKAVLDLLQSYKELNVESKNGILTITNYDQVMDSYVTRAQNSQIGVIGASANSVSKNLDQQILEVRNQLGGLFHNTALLEDSDMKELATAAANGTFESFKQVYDSMMPSKDLYMSEDNQEVYQIYRSLGESLKDTEASLKTWGISLANSAIENANLTEEQQKYAGSLVNSADALDDFTQITANRNYNSLNASELGRYYKYVRDTYGDVSIGSDGSFKVGNQNYDWKSERSKFAAWDAVTGEYAKHLQKVTQYLANLTDNDIGDQAIARAYEGKNGEELTRDDLENIKKELGQTFIKGYENFTISDLTSENSPSYEYWNKNEELRTAFNDDFESWAKTFATNIIVARDAFAHADQVFNGEAFTKATAGFTSNVVAELTNQLSQYKPDDIGGEFGANIINSLSKITTKDVGKLQQVVSAFSKVALNSEEDLRDFKNTLSAMGFDVAESEFENFINGIKESITVLTQVDVKKIDEALPDLSKIIKDIEGGEQTREFSKDLYDKLKELGFTNELLDDFVKREDGSYLYLGDKLDNIVTEIKQQTSDLLGKGREQLEAKSAAANIASGINVREGTMQQVTLSDGSVRSSYVASTEEEKQLDWLRQFVQGYSNQNIDIGQLGIEGLFSGIDVTKLTSETISRMVTQAREVIANQAFWDESLGELENTEFTTELMTKSMGELVSKIGTNAAGYDMAVEQIGEYAASQLPPEVLQQYSQTASKAMIQAVLSKATEVPADVLDQYISQFNNGTFDQRSGEQLQKINEVYGEARKEDLDIKQLQQYAEELQNLKNVSADVATSMALDTMKVNKYTKNVIDTYKDWGSLLEDGGPLGQGGDGPLEFASAEALQSFNNLKDSLKVALGLSQDLSDTFFRMPENVANLKQMVEGTVEEQEAAFKRLQAAAMVDIILNTEPASQAIVDLQNYLATLDLPNLDIDLLLHDKQFTEGLKNAIANSGEAGKAMAEALGMQQQVRQVGYQSQLVGYEFDQGAYLARDGGKSFNKQIGAPAVPVYRNIPIYRSTWEPINKNQIVPDFRSFSGGGSGSGSKSGSSPKSSSDSQKEEKPKVWLNPYDELYNLQQKINTALRERERLEHRYEDMLKDHTKLTDDLVENTLRETASLKQQLALQKQMLAGRQQQVRNVANDKYEDSEGNITTLGAMGVTRYASYDLNSNTIQIDYDAIDKITDENIGKAVEQYISRLEELQGEIVDTEDTIEDINDQLIEIRDRGKEEYLDFEQKVYDALVARREEEIEALESINSSISDAANKTINAIQEQISKERQARENEKTEQDIADKEMRLAYLQRDTSGANDLEIMKLQKEISDDQLSYQDQIIDQTIQEMQDEATRAEQQRQAQIDLLKDLLEHEKTYGMFWVDVEEKLKGAFDADGKIKVESDLYKLLQEDASWQGLSKFQSLQWTEDISKEIAIAIQGLQNYTLTEGKTKTGKLVLTDGTTLTYDSKNGTWHDSKGKKSYSDNDLYWDYGKQAYSLKPTNKAQTAASTTTRVNNAAKATTSSTSTSTTTTQKTSAPPQTPKNSEPAKLGRITNTYGWVNVRSSVAYGNNVIGHTNRGESFDVIGYGDYGWYKIKLPNGQIGYTAVHQNGTPLYSFTPYKTGGLADFTGPAWLDGTKSRPEMVLNAADTQNFIALKDILASILKNTSSTKTNTSSGDNYFDIDIQAEIDSDYDVDQLAERIKKQIYDAAEYRNVNAISLMR